jgi:hypothetical protein
MNHLENLKRFRILLLQADYAKRENNQLFNQILNTNEGLQKAIDSFKFTLSQIKNNGITEDFILAITKDDYDESMRQKYGFEIPEELIPDYLNPTTAIEKMGEIASLEVDYYGKLNNCYKKELSLHKTKAL